MYREEFSSKLNKMIFTPPTTKFFAADTFRSFRVVLSNCLVSNLLFKGFSGQDCNSTAANIFVEKRKALKHSLRDVLNDFKLVCS